jgi:hypothetical protein
MSIDHADDSQGKRGQKRDEMIQDLAQKFKQATKRPEDPERKLKER